MMEQLTPWNDFVNNRFQVVVQQYDGYELTAIACPKCGKALYKDIRTVLATYPPKYSYCCMNCGWHGVA